MLLPIVIDEDVGMGHSRLAVNSWQEDKNWRYL